MTSNCRKVLRHFAKYRSSGMRRRIYEIARLLDCSRGAGKKRRKNDLDKRGSWAGVLEWSGVEWLGGRSRKAENCLNDRTSTTTLSQYNHIICLFSFAITCQLIDSSDFQHRIQPGVSIRPLSQQWPRHSLPQQSAKWRLKSPLSSNNALRPFAWPKQCAQPLKHYLCPCSRGTING